MMRKNPLIRVSLSYKREIVPQEELEVLSSIPRLHTNLFHENLLRTLPAQKNDTSKIFDGIPSKR
jgi:hypothetical protein